MSTIDVERYLDRIGLSVDDVTSDLAGLELLQHAHLAHVPFENLSIVFGGGVPHDRSAAVAKIVERGRGGWCFELNGSFGLLLESIGFDVMILGAAVLLDGPSIVIEHLLLEVSGGEARLEPHLVDVGFGDSFETPLALNRRGPQFGGSATYEFIASPQGTTLAELVDGVPAARLRFKRVAHDFDDFAPIAASMQVDPAKHWATKPFATRLFETTSSDRTNQSYDRVTLTHDRLKQRRDGVWSEVEVAADEWDDTLHTWFSLRVHDA